MTTPPPPSPPPPLHEQAARVRADRKLFASALAVPCPAHDARAGEPCWPPADDRPPVCSARLGQR